MSQEKNTPPRLCSMFQGLDIECSCRLFENSSVGMIILGPDMRVSNANSAFLKILDETLENLKCKPFLSYVFDQDQAVVEKAFDSFAHEFKRGWTDRIKLQTSTGKIVCCRTTINGLFSGGSNDIQSYLVFAQDVTDMMLAEEKIRHLAFYDTLTSLPNRTLFMDRFDLSIAQAKRSSHQLALIYLDLDRFKAVNDTCGHDAGDELLRQVAERISGCIRESDTLARLSGDEFAILMPSVDNSNQPEALCRKVSAIMARPFEVDGHQLQISTSMGVAIYPDDGRGGEIILRAADMAMLEAKTRGRNMFVFHSKQINERAMSRLSLEKDLRGASFDDEFELVYQPQVRADERTICGFEALVRWNHGNGEQISPGRFIPMAEETGIILPLGEWVLRRACEQTVEWLKLGLDPVKVAVNVSANQVKHPGFPNIVRRILEQTGVPPEKIELEITEGIFLGDAKEIANALWKIKDLGVSFAIDDFGTGYSSFVYLKHLPIDRVKIAREFVSDILHDDDDAAIVDAISAISHSLVLHLLAEGVETKEQMDILLSKGCFEMQGYYFSKPISKDEATQCLIDCGDDAEKFFFKD